MCFGLSFTTANIMCVDAKNVYVKRISVNMFNAELDNAVKRNEPKRSKKKIDEIEGKVA